MAWTQLPPALLTLLVGTNVSSGSNSRGDPARTQMSKQRIAGCTGVRCNMAPHFLFERQLRHCCRQGVPCNPWIASECLKVGVIFTLEIQWSFMQHCTCWIGPLSISLQGLCVLCLSWYLQSSAAKQQWKKGRWMCSSLVEKPMFALGMEYAIDCWVFIVRVQLHYYYLTITSPCMSASCSVVAIASRHSLTQLECKVVTRGVWDIVAIPQWRPLGNYLQARQLAQAEAAIREPSFLRTVQTKKLSCVVNSELLPRSPPYPEPFTRPIYLNWLSPTAGRTPRNAS